MAKNEIAEKKEPTFSMVLTDGLQENKEALPVDFNIARFVQNSLALVNGNETLQKYAGQYGVAPIKQGLMRGAFLGLDALNSEFHLIPYGKDLQFIIDYRGATKLMKQYSIKPVADIFADVVKQGDNYQRWSENGEWHYKFEPIPFNNGTVIGAFAVCRFTDGTMIIEELDKAELEKIRSKSKMSNGMAWRDFTSEMYKKTAIHRLKKRIPLTFDNPQQKEIFDEDGAIEIGKQEVEVPDVFAEAEVIKTKGNDDVIDYSNIDAEMPDFLKGGD